MRLILSLFVLILMIGIASADDNQVVDNVKADLDSGAYITLTAPMNFTQLSIYDTNEGTDSHYLRIDLNGSQLWLNSNADKTLSQINYSTSADRWNWTASGTSGYLLIKGLMASPGSSYDLFADDTLFDSQTSDGSGLVSFNFNTEIFGFNHQFAIVPAVAPPTATPTAAPPFISQTGQSVQWWALFIIFIAVIGASEQYKKGKMGIGGLIAWSIIVIVIGIAATFIH